MTPAQDDQNTFESLVREGRRLPAPMRRAMSNAVRAVRRRRRGDAEQDPRGTLDQIGLGTGTDKASTIHDYLRIYEQQLGHLRDEQFQLVEIGVHKGSSTRMWAEYFQQARVVGIDIDPGCREHASDRIRIIIGDQSRSDFLARLARRLRPLVLIDDGSHWWRHQIDTFRTLFPVVRGGGYFIVEDIHTSFGEDYAATYGRGTDETAYDYLAGIARGIVAGSRAEPPRDDFEAYCRDTIESIVFLKHSLIVKKRDFRQHVFRTTSVVDLVGADEVVTTDLGPAYERVDAELVDASEQVQTNFRTLLDKGPVLYAPAHSATLSDVTVVAGGLALQRGSRIVAETLNAAQNVRRSGQLYRPADDSVWVNQGPLHVHQRVPVVPGKHHVLLKQTWDANYGHWLIDALPKVGLVPGVHDPADCLFVLNEQRSDVMRRVVLDSLAMAGVSEEQALFVDVRPHLFEELTVLGTIARHPTTKSPFVVRYLEGLAEQVEPAGMERLYLSRNRYDRRQLVNEDEVLAAVEQQGYTVVYPEELSLIEQVALFRSATHVIANMGASLANLAFSPHGVSVLALATERMNHDYFYDIVCHKQGRYRGLQGRAVTEPGVTPDIGSDFRVDIAHLDESLDWLHRGGTD